MCHAGGKVEQSTAYAFELEAATIVQPEEVEAAVQRVVAGAPVLA